MRPDTAHATDHHQALDVIVIGAGQAGLAIAWHLAQRQVRFVVLDAGPQVGHVWRSRWDSLTLFTPAEYDALPGMPFPAPAGTYPTKDQVADYLQAYAASFELPVRLNTRVTRLRRAGDLFAVATSTGTLLARQVVVATGLAPHIPAVGAALDDAVTQVHSAQYRNSHDLPDGPVLVVGAGNSGLQIAEELAATRPVTVAVGTRPLMLPQRLLGRDLFWWFTRLGLMDKPADSRIARRVRARCELVIGTSWRRLRGRGITVRPRVVDAHERTIRFADGTALEVGTVVWATGFRSDYSWIDAPPAVVDGRVVHRRGVTDVPGLYFLGLPWQHTRGSALLGFVKDDAAWLADQLTADRATALAGT
ncbi:FAD dependent oxidoreductase [Carbonactinospora thermoautotrophica]|uniref:FAD dependent oxidoreductase n=1 Tax=Carbonactinospora thermoautotrophica TaxID=1469144 RepID=A0A132MW26_9ACTN|nr:NAD(P)/FAD-dependent oxidoreductase [Carbonactinospora thermoautotrophica]KWX02105.1 FAD dependent oxidoreductase [Carbonactinospora thermoautotrophica]